MAAHQSFTVAFLIGFAFVAIVIILDRTARLTTGGDRSIRR